MNIVVGLRPEDKAKVEPKPQTAEQPKKKATDKKKN